VDTYEGKEQDARIILRK